MVKSAKKQSEKSALEKLCRDFVVYAHEKRAAEAEMKALKTRIIEIVEKDPGAYFDGKRGFKIDDVEITLKPIHNYNTSDEFDLATFMNRYPNSIEWKFKHSKMENISLDSWGIEHRSTDLIDVSAKITV
jgi:hypothetical protein